MAAEMSAAAEATFVEEMTRETLKRLKKKRKKIVVKRRRRKKKSGDGITSGVAEAENNAE